MNHCLSKACLKNKSEIWTTLPHTSLSSHISLFNRDNLEFVNKSPDVLRNHTLMNLIEGFSKREHRDRQLRCVDTCTGKRHLTGHEQMLESQGTDESIRTDNVITLARAGAFVCFFARECRCTLRRRRRGTGSAATT